MTLDDTYNIVSQFYRCNLRSASHKPKYVRARRAFIYLAKMRNTPDLVIGQFINRHRTHVYGQHQLINDLIQPVNGSGYVPDRELANDIQQIMELMAKG